MMAVEGKNTLKITLRNTPKIPNEIPLSETHHEQVSPEDSKVHQAQELLISLLSGGGMFKGNILKEAERNNVGYSDLVAARDQLSLSSYWVRGVEYWKFSEYR